MGKIKKLNELRDGFKIGTCSRRRELQLKKLNKNFIVESVRGNIDTRIKKLDEKNLMQLCLAAGVKSLNLEKKIDLFFKLTKFYLLSDRNHRCSM